MELDKSLVSGSMAMLVLKLLEDGDKYGYQMIEELCRRSDDTPCSTAWRRRGW